MLVGGPGAVETRHVVRLRLGRYRGGLHFTGLAPLVPATESRCLTSGGFCGHGTVSALHRLENRRRLVPVLRFSGHRNRLPFDYHRGCPGPIYPKGVFLHFWWGLCSGRLFGHAGGAISMYHIWRANVPMESLSRGCLVRYGTVLDFGGVDSAAGECGAKTNFYLESLSLIILKTSEFTPKLWYNWARR